jgi:hypothetical protein
MARPGRASRCPTGPVLGGKRTRARRSRNGADDPTGRSAIRYTPPCGPALLVTQDPYANMPVLQGITRLTDRFCGQSRRRAPPRQPERGC